MAKRKKKVIDPDRFYTLGEIVREKLIPGLTSVVSASRLVEWDSKHEKVLGGVRVPRGVRGVQYKVKGSNIIQYLVNLNG